MKNKKQVKTTTKRAILLVCVCVRAQTEQLSGVVDRLRKKKNERKKKKNVLFAMQRQISLSLAWFFFTPRSNSSRGPLFVNIHMERKRLFE